MEFQYVRFGVKKPVFPLRIVIFGEIVRHSLLQNILYPMSQDCGIVGFGFERCLDALASLEANPLVTEQVTNKF